MPVISVYYSQDSLDNIDFEEALDDEEGEYLYDNADYVGVHDALSDELTSSENFESVPELFTHYSGQTY